MTHDHDDLGTAWDWFWDFALAFILIGLVAFAFSAAGLLTNKTDGAPHHPRTSITMENVK